MIRADKSWAILAGLVAVSTALRSFAGLRVPTPWIAPDEMVYGLLGRGLYHAGHLAILGGSTPFYSAVVPLLAWPTMKKSGTLCSEGSPLGYKSADTVITPQAHQVAVEAFEAQPASLSPIAAFRAAVAQTVATLTPEEFARFSETTELTLTVPEVRARALDEFARTIDQIAAAVAKRTGRSPDDFAVRTMAGAVIGVIMSATTPWARQPSTDTFERIDAALAHLEAGLPL